MLKGKKMINVRVGTPASTVEFAIDSSATGKQLFDQVINTMGIKEIWYFGLDYTDSTGFSTWVKFNKKLTKQGIKKDSQGFLNFSLCVRYYPEDVSMLNDNSTLRTIYMHVKELILNDEISCSPGLGIMLASYYAQSKYGDYNPEIHRTGFLDNDRMFSPRLLIKVAIEDESLERRVMNLWAEHKGQTNEQAMLSYLKLAQGLDMYGVTYFDVRNKDNGECYIGVHACGLNIYDCNDKVIPRIRYRWPEIKYIKYNGKKFTIKHINNHEKDFSCFAKRSRIAKKIFNTSMGNHELSLRRRSMETLQAPRIRHDQTALELDVSGEGLKEDQESVDNDLTNKSEYHSLSVQSTVSETSVKEMISHIEDQQRLFVHESPDEHRDVNSRFIQGEFVSSKTFSCGNRSIETIKYQIEKDGVLETHVEHRVIINDTNEVIDHDAELQQAILEATRMNPNMTVEKIEVMQETAC